MALTKSAFRGRPEEARAAGEDFASPGWKMVHEVAVAGGAPAERADWQAQTEKGTPMRDELARGVSGVEQQRFYQPAIQFAAGDGHRNAPGSLLGKGDK